VFGRIPNHIQLIATDFERDDWGSVLSTNGYSSNLQTFFIWEAVSQFLTNGGIQTTCEFLSKAQKGSRLLFTYILKDFLTGENLYGQEKTFQLAVEKGYWDFGLHPDEVSNFLEKYGWRVGEHLDYDELAEKYVRPTGRDLSALPIERMVLAVKS
jgi:methyltransferase (TIGR00027 family)